MAIPRPEHPRPDLQREQWLNLNGPWHFGFDPRAVGEQERWHPAGAGPRKDQTINVPFPWESALSGVAARDYKGAAWYEREITVPADWAGRRVFLHFGAVDWSARVWLNGRLIAEHENGYLPFSVDVTDQVGPGQSAILTVRAYDIADSATLVGKQVLYWYTHTSGIWQTVWLEARAPSHVENLQITPDLPNEQVEVLVTLTAARSGAYRLRLRSPKGEFPTFERGYDLAVGSQTLSVRMPVPAPRLWSPESPDLYDLIVELEPTDGAIADRLQSYFGMRSVGRGLWNGNDYEYVLLNGEPVYLRGALDQAFNPEGIYSYPSDEAVRADVELAKATGLNMLRCHIKVNDPRYYYWADKLGVLIFADIPNAMIDTPRMRRSWEATVRGAIARDFNHPSIMAWILFNETWGLTNHDRPSGHAWVRDMYLLAKTLDPSRAIEDNSPNKYDHVVTDLNSWHFYINDYQRARRHVARVDEQTYPGSTFNYVGGEYAQGREPLLNSEYAGISAAGGDMDISWSFKYLTNELRRYAKICGYVYTELTDVEWEHNGYVNYDRSAKEFGYDAFVPGMALQDLNSPDFVGVDAPPCQTLAPGAELVAPVFVSHWGPALSSAQVRWQLDFVDRFGEGKTIEQGTLAIVPRRFDVVSAGELRLTLPNEAGLATLALILEDERGEIRGRNYVNVEVHSEPSPRVESRTNGWALRFAPGDLVDTSWPNPVVESGGAKFSATGRGWVEYAVAAPAGSDLGKLHRLRVRLEASARAGQARVDWRERARPGDYPQTEATKKSPSDLTFSLNGVAIGQTTLPDDPADARGVLSHHRSFDPGSYGYLVDFSIDGTALETVRERLRAGEPLRLRLAIPDEAEHPGGLAIYGETLGGTPVEPTVWWEEER